jgi:hypothetical protein
LIENLVLACDESGFYLPHAMAAQGVAERVNCIVLFREPGKMAAGLIAEGYAMKGFRIDTKSCTWGPMAGFVCMDPRLTKDEVYVARNRTWTHEAVSGEINKKFFGDVTDPDWVGDVAPIVLSRRRIDYLTTQNVIRPSTDTDGHLVGTSKATKGDAVLPWRLIPVGNAAQPWLKAALPTHHVLCIDTSAKVSFKQELPNEHGLKAPIQPVRFRGYEAVMGLCNPQTSMQLGFKACVTADYDLFSIWPGTKNGDQMANRHTVNSIITGLKPGTGQSNTLAGGVARMVGVDTRLQADGLREHHRYGDVSSRVLTVKALLNSAIQNPGGNAVHHNDEAGNFALAKGTLKDCLPIVAFIPGIFSKTSRGEGSTALIETLDDFKTIVEMARDLKFSVIAKPAWLQEANAN